MAIALTALLRWLWPDVLSPAPYLGFYPAVVVAAILGGVGPGIVATFTSLLLVNFVFVQFDFWNYGLQMRNLIWIVASVGVSILAGRLLIARRQAQSDADTSRAAEAALRRQAELLRLSFDAVISWRLDGGIESWNVGAEQLYGYRESEVLGRSTHDLLRTVHHKPWPEIEAEMVEKGYWEGELSHFTRDGREVVVSARKRLIHGDDGITRVLEINRDVTERKKAEDDLRTTSGRFYAILSNLYSGILLVTAEGRVEFANQAFCERFGLNEAPDDLAGLSAETMIGKIRNVYLNPDQDLARIQQLLDCGEPVKGEEIAMRSGMFLRDFVPLNVDGKSFGRLWVHTDITKRKQAEEALRQTLERLKRVLEVETVGVMFWDLNTGSMVDANDAFLELMGYSRSQVEAGELTWQKLTPPEYMDVSRAEIEKFVVTGRVGPYEKEYFRSDGTRQWLLFAGSSLGNNQCVEFCVDISKRKKAEEALRASEERLDLTVKAAEIGTWDFDPVNGSLIWSERCKALFGVPPQDQVGYQTFLDRLHPDDRERTHQVVQRALDPIERGEFDTEYRAVWPDGTQRWIAAAGKAFFGEVDGRRCAVRFIGTVMDITSRKQAEEALRASEERWATTLQSIGDAVISTCAQGKIIFMNEVAQNLTGWQLAQAQGRHLDEVFNIVQEVTRIKPESPVAKVVRSGQVVGLANHTLLIRRDGTEIPIEDSGAPIRNRDGKIEGVVLVFHDVSEQRKMEHAVRTSDRLATTGRLAATIAHEIHNPLDTVGNLLFLAQKTTQEQRTREQLSMAAEELSRITQMTQQMLTFQRESAQPVPVQVEEVIDSVLALYQRKIESASIRINREIDLSHPLLAQPGELRQVLANLIGNAIEAVGRDRGKIRLRAYESRDWRNGRPGVRVVIADNGRGIPAEFKARIFEPFFTTKGEAGTGLGLWVTSDIIRKYNGTMQLNSSTRADRSGTCFSVFLPFPVEPSCGRE